MECDGCTLCCQLFPVKCVNKEANEICKYCVVGVGCKIYNNLDKECKDFNCAYIQSNCSEKLRPDKCKVIFEKIGDDIFFGTMHPNYPTAYLDEVIQGQSINFHKQGYSVIFSSFNTPYIFTLPKEGRTVEEVLKKYKRQVELLTNDNSII